MASTQSAPAGESRTLCDVPDRFTAQRTRARERGTHRPRSAHPDPGRIRPVIVVRRGRLRELGVRVSPDGHVRAPHRLPRPEGFGRIATPRQARSARRGPSRAPRRPGCALAGAKRLGARAAALRELPGHRLRDLFRAVDLASRADRRRRLQRGSAAARRQGRHRLAVRPDLTILVRVVPELAKRVPRRRRDHRRLRLLAPTLLTAVQARARSQLRNGRLDRPGSACAQTMYRSPGPTMRSHWQPYGSSSTCTVPSGCTSAVPDESRSTARTPAPPAATAKVTGAGWSEKLCRVTTRPPS